MRCHPPPASQLTSRAPRVTNASSTGAQLYAKLHNTCRYYKQVYLIGYVCME